MGSNPIYFLIGPIKLRTGWIPLLWIQLPIRPLYEQILFSGGKVCVKHPNLLEWVSLIEITDNSERLSPNEAVISINVYDNIFFLAALSYSFDFIGKRIQPLWWLKNLPSISDTFLVILHEFLGEFQSSIARFVIDIHYMQFPIIKGQ